MRPGWVRIGVTANPQSGVYVTAFKNASTGDFAIVAINQNGSGTAQTVNLSGFTAPSVVPWVTSASLNLAAQSSVTISGGAFSYTLPADSVTTFAGTMSSGAGTFYICDNTGAPCNAADTNAGTSKTATWLHDPMMANCTGVCDAHTIVPGDQFIHIGGGVWHAGNSAAVPYTGINPTCGYNGTVSAAICMAGLHGTSSNPIYYGVDLTWFEGGGGHWTRPIITGDNPLTPHPTVFGDFVASCAYQVGTWNNVLIDESSSYITIDNIEFTGLCQPLHTGTPAGGGWAGHDYYINEGAAQNNIYEHLYFHGWTHLQFNCTTVSGNPSGNCFNLRAFNGSNASPGSQYIQDVVDGADSDPAGLTVMYDGGYNVSQSVFRYTAQIIPGPIHIWHDNLFTNIYGPGDGQAHGNLFEDLGEATGTNAVYNNVFQHVCLAGTCPSGLVGIWLTPPTGTSLYFFNNLVFDSNIGTSNYFNVGANDRNIGPHIVFNNTFEQPNATYTIISCSFAGFTFPLTLVNNHYITDNASPYASSCAGQETAPPLTEIAMTHSAATGYGYTGAQTYAFSPITSGLPTVGTGTNKQSFCTALASAGLSDAATACQSATSYACVYSTLTHSVTCPNLTPTARPASAPWDKGTYQFQSVTPPPPTVPTGRLPGTLVINQKGPSITGPGLGLPQFTVGVPFKLTYTATSCHANPCVWSITGTLPPGCTFSGGIISCVPTTAGTYNYVVAVQ